MTIRLLLVRLPRLLADLTTEALTRDPRLGIGRVDVAGSLADAVEQARDGVVVAAVDDPVAFTAACTRSVGRRQPVVVGITPDGRLAWLLELRLRSLGQLSPADLRAVVTDALQQRAS